MRTLLLSAAVFLASLAGPAALVSAQGSSTPAEGAAAAPAPAEDPQPGTEPSTTPATGGDEDPADDTTSEDPPTGEDPPPNASDDPGTQSVRAKSSNSVSAGDNFFDPASLTIAVGDSVTWTNDGKVAHTVTANGGSFDSGNLNPGHSFTHTFSQAGTFRYFCQYHAGMTGTIKVTSSSSSSGGGGGTGSSGSTSTTSGAGGSGTAPAAGPGSESAAGASPGAAGSGTQLPSTGAPLEPLAALGAGLVCLGALLRRRTKVG
jgi:LPXTG-motif cell wall-anchored protein